jgi:23S rRNA (cytidine1920-2'-O)/16S rRNA (cytidine1409-2'-O)-methyltransferase
VLGPPPRFVGRGGEKLDAALHQFAIDVRGRRAIDAGASTGGFTDALLQNGADRVVAVDVGYGQLHQRLRNDHRVHVRERTNIRHVTPADLGGPAPIVVADLSFISLKTVAPALLTLAEPGGDLVLLVKPQFEAGRAEAGKGRGVVRDPTVWRRVLDEVVAAYQGVGASIIGCMVSPLRGADGNVEFLLHLAVDGGAAGGRADLALDAVVAEARG